MHYNNLKLPVGGLEQGDTIVKKYPLIEKKHRITSSALIILILSLQNNSLSGQINVLHIHTCWPMYR